VPREVFVAGNDADLDIRLPVEDVVEFFDIVIDIDHVALRSSQFLRRLRNSVVHARFSVDNMMNFRFTDRRPQSAQDEFIITASSANLMDFLSRIGAFLANLRANPLANANGEDDR